MYSTTIAGSAEPCGWSGRHRAGERGGGGGLGDVVLWSSFELVRAPDVNRTVISASRHRLFEGSGQNSDKYLSSDVGSVECTGSRCLDRLAQTRRVGLIGSAGAFASCRVAGLWRPAGARRRTRPDIILMQSCLELCYYPLSDDVVRGIWQNRGKTCATHDLT